MATWQTNKAVFNLKAIDNQQDFYKNEKMKVFGKSAAIPDINQEGNTSGAASTLQCLLLF